MRGSLLASALLLLVIAATVSAQQPLTLPTLTNDAPCLITPAVTGVVPRQPHIFGGPRWFGNGPAYMAVLWGEGNRFNLDRIPVERGMRRAKTAWVADPVYKSVIEIRGRSLRADGRPLLFDTGGSGPSERLRLTATNAVLEGGWVGRDGKPLPAPPSSGPEWHFWPTSTYIPGPGCYGIQIDTARGSHTVVFEAIG